ncbi:TetR/AcrR family transcriptional regulator [Curvibacter sp. APW13]|uniref:TetR/AcrR family transcriptional regulator n=1 Tax=Curvibacter sp. APW13 TaxID=3077236 RepID=UPI0028E0017B|nr:TetR/AcrR family transcriptional regulator [Curvibacter sp. APW13]MDT8990656.1 TetR/AcrR family transcriptional regulator [Curvibacter sp. APW13]
MDGRKANAETTQAALRAAGRRLFGELGFEKTALGALCAEAGVTTGALYHHFGDKKGLFAAVAEELDAALVLVVQAAMAQATQSGATPWEAFLAGIDAFLAAAQDAQARRIGLTDAPAVLGTQGWLEIRERQGLGAMVRTVEGLQAAGAMPVGDTRLRARLILGLLYGALEALDHDSRPWDQALPDARALLHAMLAGLLTGMPGFS